MRNASFFCATLLVAACTAKMVAGFAPMTRTATSTIRVGAHSRRPCFVGGRGCTTPSRHASPSIAAMPSRVRLAAAAAEEGTNGDTSPRQRVTIMISGNVHSGFYRVSCRNEVRTRACEPRRASQRTRPSNDGSKADCGGGFDGSLHCRDALPAANHFARESESGCVAGWIYARG